VKWAAPEDLRSKNVIGETLVRGAYSGALLMRICICMFSNDLCGNANTPHAKNLPHRRFRDRKSCKLCAAFCSTLLKALHAVNACRHRRSSRAESASLKAVPPCPPNVADSQTTSLIRTSGYLEASAFLILIQPMPLGSDRRSITVTHLQGCMLLLTPSAAMHRNARAIRHFPGGVN